ncbi:two-partner secretion domain-containing protein [Pseudomonas sp. RT6P73]
MPFQHTSRLAKPLSRGVLPTTFALLAVAIQASMPSFAVAQGLPALDNVIQGQATVSASGTSMNITQGSTNAVIGWGSFDIAQGHSVNFQVPAGGATLNQIAGPASQINGSLSSNGTLFLINPNGVLLGNSAQVNVGSLVASTSQLTANDFMNGQQTFTAGGTGVLSNAGSITANSGGYVVLAGAGEIRNLGTIKVANGTVQMVSADKFILTQSTQNPFLNITVDGTAKGGNVTHQGTVSAGTVTLQAQGAVRSLGRIQAASLGDLKGSVNLSGNRVIIAESIDSAGDITVTSGSRTHIGAGLSAAHHIDIKSQDSVSLTNAELHSARGDIKAFSQHKLVLAESVLKTQNGDILLSGQGGGINTTYGANGAVDIDNTTLTAASNIQNKGNILINGHVETSGLADAALTPEKQGVVIRQSTLTSNNMNIDGTGALGVLLEGNTLNANNLSLSGNAEDFKNDGEGVVIFGNNTLAAQNDLVITGKGGQAGVVLSGVTTLNGQNIDVSGHTTSATPTDKNGIKFYTPVHLQVDHASPNAVKFSSNGTTVTPPTVF